MQYFNQIKADIVKGKPRPAWTYRGARRNADRENAPSKWLRSLRKHLGLNRTQFNRWQAGDNAEQIAEYLKDINEKANLKYA